MGEKDPSGKNVGVGESLGVDAVTLGGTVIGGMFELVIAKAAEIQDMSPTVSHVAIAGAVTAGVLLLVEVRDLVRR